MIGRQHFGAGVRFFVALAQPMGGVRRFTVPGGARRHSLDEPPARRGHRAPGLAQVINRLRRSRSGHASLP
ncbi:hypothetical protein ACFVZM_18120 [Streptomyces sioyaensis]|uniref:hypothetical protein n=1 Tax=Streptomyces sioyaensis TaxID=67364 RepID=UPI0036787D75